MYIIIHTRTDMHVNTYIYTCVSAHTCACPLRHTHTLICTLHVSGCVCGVHADVSTVTHGHSILLTSSRHTSIDSHSGARTWLPRPPPLQQLPGVWLPSAPARQPQRGHLRSSYRRGLLWPRSGLYLWPAWLTFTSVGPLPSLRGPGPPAERRCPEPPVPTWALGLTRSALLEAEPHSGCLSPRP